MKLESAATESSRGAYFKGMFHRPGVPIRANFVSGALGDVWRQLLRLRLREGSSWNGWGGGEG